VRDVIAHHLLSLKRESPLVIEPTIRRQTRRAPSPSRSRIYPTSGNYRVTNSGKPEFVWERERSKLASASSNPTTSDHGKVGLCAVPGCNAPLRAALRPGHTFLYQPIVIPSLACPGRARTIPLDWGRVLRLAVALRPEHRYHSPARLRTASKTFSSAPLIRFPRPTLRSWRHHCRRECMEPEAGCNEPRRRHGHIVGVNTQIGLDAGGEFRNVARG
jgi:hypothetical protein